MNEDWETTCVIYEVEEPRDQWNNSGAWLNVQVSVRDAILVQTIAPPPDADEHIIDPAFIIRLLNQEQHGPLLKVEFEYDDSIVEDSPAPVSACVSWTHFPAVVWHEGHKRSWLKWLNDQIKEILEEQQNSFAVCDFLEHDALAYFNRHEQDGTTILVSLQPEIQERPNDLQPLDGTIVDSFRFEERLRAARGARNGGSTASGETQQGGDEHSSPVMFARAWVESHWKSWFEAQCPICFDAMPMESATEISCGHMFCRECISKYCEVVVDGLRFQKQNPFTCPIPTCRRPMKLVGCVKQFVHREQMDKIRLWHKNIVNPLSQLLQRCPRKRCQQPNMRKHGSDSTHVYCEDCNVTWCEACLVKVEGGYHDYCDPTDLLLLITRYDAASERVKTKCEERWPWIKEYATAKVDDSIAMRWMDSYTTRCPSCRTLIERIDGCFHMRCTECGTHFCFECGVEFFAPYYGTHNCWEERNRRLDNRLNT